MRTGAAPRTNNGQLSRTARFNVRDPWLPPVISTVGGPPGGLGGMENNSWRTGRPVTSVFPVRKKAAVSGNETSARYTKRPMTRLVNPDRKSVVWGKGVGPG